MNTRPLAEAHLPTFFKASLREAASGHRSYNEVGWHLGHYHPDTFDLDEERVLRVTNAELDHPSAALRRLFATPEHPKAGLVDYIPVKRRGAFLRGLVCGVAGHELEDAKDFRWDE